MGFYAGLFSGSTYVDYGVELKGADGKVLETHGRREEVAAGGFGGLSSGERLASAGGGLGLALGYYLRARTQGVMYEADLD